MNSAFLTVIEAYMVMSGRFLYFIPTLLFYICLFFVSKAIM